MGTSKKKTSDPFFSPFLSLAKGLMKEIIIIAGVLFAK